MAADDRLTLVVPTHNRPERLRALLTFLRECGVSWRVLVADSSKTANTEVATLGVDRLEYRYFGDDHPILSKLRHAVSQVTTPYTVLLPDDDITLPHALEAAVGYLIAHPDYVVAHGYVLDFAIHENTFDVTRVRWFTPSIDETEPLDRMYHLVRRYQPFFWAVFSTQALIASIDAGDAQGLVALQEMAFMNAAAIRGKIARLPVVFNLRGPDESMTPLEQTHPLYALLDNAENFFAQYHKYRDYLASLIDGSSKAVPPPVAVRIKLFFSSDPPPQSAATRQLKQLIDLIHVTSFGRELDLGVVNYETQVLLGRPLEPQRPVLATYAWQPPRERDVVRAPAGEAAGFIWRREVFEGEPRDEITITSEEVAAVERQLAHYPTGQGAAIAGHWPTDKST